MVQLNKNTGIAGWACYALLFTVLFGYGNPENGGYELTGNLTGFPDRTMIYLRDINTEENIDSAQIINGHFSMVGKLPFGPEQLWLHATVGGKFLYTNLLIDNEQVYVRGDKADFPWHVEISGSIHHDHLAKVKNMTRDNDIQRELLVEKYFQLSAEDQKNEGRAIWGTIRELDSLNLSRRISFLKTNIDTYAGLTELGFLKHELPKDTVEILYGRLSPELKKSKYGKKIFVYLSGTTPLIGDRYLDFDAEDKHGKNIRFADIIKDRYVLLEFTAAYCGPCIEAADELKQIDSLYRNSIEVVSFSVDAKRETWLTSLERDLVSWKSLWDGKATFGDTYINYGITALPTFILIAPNGIIVDRWTGYGKQSIHKKLFSHSIIPAPTKE